MKFQSYICAFAIGCSLLSCSKSESHSSESTVTTTYIKDLVGDTAASVGDEADKTRRDFYPLIFNLTNQESHLLANKTDSNQYATSLDWDIAFTSQYNSVLVVNNGNYEGTLGYGGKGTAQIIYTDQSFDNVSTAPSDETFTANALKSVGWDDGNQRGWFYYSLTNHIAVPIKNRTFIFKTSQGLYGKIEIQNIYKGNPSVVTDLYWPRPYISFHYFLQTDGSTNLNTK